LSRESMLNVGAEIVPELEATYAAPTCEVPLPHRGRRPHHVAKGIRRNLGDLVSDRSVTPHRPASGRRGAEADDVRHEKSASAIVAVKPTNKAGPPAAEPVERKGRDRGERGTAKHAPDTEPARVNPGAGRVRQAARQRKTETVHRASSPHHGRYASDAYYALRRKAAPGVDGVTWEDYEVDLEPRLKICTIGSIAASTGRNHPAGRIY